MAESLRLSGLATGLDTSTLISQLMSFERRPIGMMQKVQKTAQSRIDIYRSINTKLAALQRAADKVKGLSFSTSTAPTAAGATVANPALLAASVTGSPTAGTYNITVNSLAQSQITGGGTFNTPGLGPTTSATVADPSIFTASAANGTAPGTYDVTVNSLLQNQVYTAGTGWQSPSGRTLTINVNGVNTNISFNAAQGTNAGTAATRINQFTATTGVTADASSGKLVLTGSNGNAFTLSGTAASRMRLTTGSGGSVTTTAQKASISIDGGPAIQSNSNTFTNPIPGVTINALAVGTSQLTLESIGGTLRISNTTNGTSTDVDIASGSTITQVRDAINAANTGMTASISGGKLTLTGNDGSTFTVADAGGGNAFATSLGIDSATKTTQTASQASVTVNGTTTTSPGNTVANAINGLSLNLTATGSTTIDVTAASAGSSGGSDPTAAVQDLVDKLNDVLTYIKDNSTYNTTTKKAGMLTGDYTANNLRRDLTKMVTGLVDDSSTYYNGFSAGLELQRDGTIKFDTAKFQAALTADSTAVKNLFAREDNQYLADGITKSNTIGTTGTAGDGIANRLSAYVESMVSKSSMYNTVDSVSGLRTVGGLLGAIEGNEKVIGTLDKRIEEYEVRLKEKERALLAKFSAMEKSVAMLRNQGNYLSGQFFAMSQGR